ncbi:alpha-mannosidase [Microbacterium sp. I2]
MAVGVALAERYSPLGEGDAWGRAWGTTWFRLAGTVPAAWRVHDDELLELSIDIGFTDGRAGFQAEGLLWDAAGRVLKGIEPLQRNFAMPEGPGDAFVYYVEAAANPDIAQDFTFVPTTLGDQSAAGAEHLYRLGPIEVGIRHMPTWHLEQDLRVLAGLASGLTATGARRDSILMAVERALNVIDPDDVRGSAGRARRELSPVLTQPAHASAHRIHAVGHAHIDSAWLWPVRETRRKVARSFANVLALMEQHPDLTFAASSAQQYAWIKTDYPELYERVKGRVAEGRFIPVGGQWVEPDCNLPSGESMARQFIEGKQFFIREFGVEPLEVWVPDSFGYSASLPQIAAAAGSRYFLTQKISWNETNVFPHHSFLWEGIDGTRMFTHFPPADTYHAHVSAQELLLAESQFADGGRTNVSLLPFGWGDGGGGPTEEMLASAARFADLEGAPRVSLSTPSQFFADATADDDDLPVWVGELYLERHRGVSTTQVALKRGNRLAERLLREAELWCTVATVRAGLPYPAEDLSRIWQAVLLLQFHDILPGSSITWVHREAAGQYAALHAELENLIDAAARHVMGRGGKTAHLNAGPLPLEGVPGLGAVTAGDPALERGRGPHADRLSTGDTLLENHLLRVVISSEGAITSLIDRQSEREIIPPGSAAGELRLHHDTPTTWDAWDLDKHYLARAIEPDGSVDVSILEIAPGVPAVVITRDIGASSARIEYRLSPVEARLEVSIDLDWREDEKLLKYMLPLDVHADRVATEVGFGHVYRPTHTNTSWEEARFEVVAHRWLHVGEPGYGVALANEATYGYSLSREAFGESVGTVIGISLARAPRYPDPESDRGHHHYRFALRLGAGIPEAVSEGYRLNVPIREVRGVETGDIDPLLRVDAPGVVVEAVKLADDGSGDVIVRLYESYGNRARCSLTTAFDAGWVTESDLLERPAEPRVVLGEPADGRVDLELRPFQLVTLRIARGRKR